MMLLLSLLVSFAQAEILCKRDPQVTPVGAEFSSKDTCVGTVKLQAMAFKCGKVEEVAERTSEFLEAIIKEAAEFCKEFCEKRGKGCVGEFDAPLQCGFSVKPKEALSIGLEASCWNYCEGSALSYCSLYKGSGFLVVEESAFKDKRPNCFCRRKK